MVGSPDASGSLPPFIAALPFLCTNAEPFLLQRLPRSSVIGVCMIVPLRCTTLRCRWSWCTFLYTGFCSFWKLSLHKLHDVSPFLWLHRRVDSTCPVFGRSRNFLNTDFSYEHHCTFNLCSDLPWIQQRFFSGPHTDPNSFVLFIQAPMSV